MNNISMTKHAQCRKQQRGFRSTDVSLILRTAKQVASDAYMLTKKDAAREIAKRKREIQQLERLKGSKIIIVGDRLITCYHADKQEQRRTMRRVRAFQ